MTHARTLCLAKNKALLWSTLHPRNILNYCEKRERAKYWDKRRRTNESKRINITPRHGSVSIRACRVLADCRNFHIESRQSEAKYRHRRTSSSHLNELIPLFRRKKKVCVKSQAATGDNFSVIFWWKHQIWAGFNYCGDQWLIQHGLVKLEVLPKSMDAEELAQRLILSPCMIHPDQL